MFRRRVSRLSRVFRVRPHGHNVAAMCASLQARRCRMGASASVCVTQITCLKTTKHMYEQFVAQMHHFVLSETSSIHLSYIRFTSVCTTDSENNILTAGAKFSARGIWPKHDIVDTIFHTLGTPYPSHLPAYHGVKGSIVSEQ